MILSIYKKKRRERKTKAMLSFLRLYAISLAQFQCQPSHFFIQKVSALQRHFQFIFKKCEQRLQPCLFACKTREIMTKKHKASRPGHSRQGCSLAYYVIPDVTCVFERGEVNRAVPKIGRTEALLRFEKFCTNEKQKSPILKTFLLSFLFVEFLSKKKIHQSSLIILF